ncbi:MAG: HEAT repeat domain-containing protein [Planctomycetes bacterium]|nr:HEAT repeat domain-containing protein [Planctomycetota bacterium]
MHRLAGLLLLLWLVAPAAPGFAQEHGVEIGLAAKPSLDQKTPVVEVRGWTNLPDGVAVELALSYLGTRLRWARGVVKDGKFGASIELAKGVLLPSAVYAVEALVFPNRQDRPELAALSYRETAIPLPVGTPEEIQQTRRNHLYALKELTEALRRNYDPLRELYAKYEKETGFDERRWGEEVAAQCEAIGKVAAVVAERRIEYAVQLFPAIEEGLNSFTELMAELPTHMQARLALDRRDKAAAEHLGAGTFLENADDAVKRSYQPLVEQIALKEKMPDEGPIRVWLAKVDALHKGVSTAFHARYERKAVASDTDWLEAEAALKAALPILEAGLKQFAQTGFFNAYPEQLSAMKEMPALLEAFQGVCRRVLDGKAEAGAVAAGEDRLTNTLASVTTLLGLATSIPDSFSAATPAGAATLSPEGEQQLRRDLGLFAGGPPLECTEAGIRIARLGRVAVPFLLEGLSGADRNTGLWSAKTLSMIEDERAVPALIQFYRTHRETEVELLVIESVGIMGPGFRAASAPFLVEEIKSQAVEVRLACVQAMKAVKDPLFRPIACDCLNDPDPQVRERAGLLLETLTGENVFTSGYSSNAPESERRSFAAAFKEYLARRQASK